MGIFDVVYEYYFLVLILQGICAFHSIRNGTQSKWIWIIVFLPFIGSVAYIFTEIIQKRHVDGLQNSVSGLINPIGRISDLEKQFKLSGTFNHRVALADAYMHAGMFDKAVETYEPGLTGVFEDNEHVIRQLLVAYFQLERYEDVIRMTPRIYKTLDFSKSHSNLVYALALEKTGKTEQAEKEFKAMNHRFSNFEQRFEYGQFLIRQNKKKEAAHLYQEIVNEAEQMNRSEKGNSRQWIDKSYQQLKQLEKEL